MITMSGIGKFFEEQPVTAAQEENESSCKMRRLEKSDQTASLSTNNPTKTKNKTLRDLSADIQILIESYLDPIDAARLARCSKALYQAHVNGILIANPSVAGRLAILDVAEMPQTWKDKLISQKNSIKSIVLPEPRDHFVPGPPGYEHCRINLKSDHRRRHFRNIVSNTPQVQCIDLSNFQHNAKSSIPLANDMLPWRSLPNLKNIRGLVLGASDHICFIGDFKERNLNFEKLLFLGQGPWLQAKTISDLFTLQVQSLSIEDVNTSASLLELAKHGNIVTSLELDIFKEKMAPDVIQKMSKSFPNLTKLSIEVYGKPSKEMIKALGEWLTKTNLPGLTTVDFTLKKNESTISYTFDRFFTFNLLHACDLPLKDLFTHKR